MLICAWCPGHCKCYKLLVDPAIVGKGSEKLYRYDGKTAPGVRLFYCSMWCGFVFPHVVIYCVNVCFSVIWLQAKPVTVHDPRGYQYKANIRGEALDLPVPRFKVFVVDRIFN